MFAYKYTDSGTIIYFYKNFNELRAIVDIKMCHYGCVSFIVVHYEKYHSYNYSSSFFYEYDYSKFMNKFKNYLFKDLNSF